MEITLSMSFRRQVEKKYNVSNIKANEGTCIRNISKMKLKGRKTLYVKLF